MWRIEKARVTVRAEKRGPVHAGCRKKGGDGPGVRRELRGMQSNLRFAGWHEHKHRDSRGHATCNCVCVCVCARAHVRACLHACACACVHAGCCAAALCVAGLGVMLEHVLVRPHRLQTSSGTPPDPTP